MNINKAIRKQKKSYRRFMLSMCFIFLMLPIALFLSGLHENMFFCSYMIFIEILIAMAMFIRANKERLEFQYHNNRMKISAGIVKRNYVLLCDKVSIVHTENREENDDFLMIIVMETKFRNNKIKIIGEEFLKRYPYMGDVYLKLKKKNPEKIYYYMVIRRGGMKKYLILDALYRSCMKAVFTDEAIENVKKVRING